MLGCGNDLEWNCGVRYLIEEITAFVRLHCSGVLVRDTTHLDY